MIIETKMKLNLIGIIACLLLTSVISAHAENDEDVFSKARHYTVQIRKAVSIPFGNDKKGTAFGAGFVVDTKRGWIMTNAHVVSRSPARLEVAFFGRKFVPAKKIYVDPFLDLAIISINEEMQNATAALTRIRVHKSARSWPYCGHFRPPQRPEIHWNARHHIWAYSQV